MKKIKNAFPAIMLAALFCLNLMAIPVASAQDNVFLKVGEAQNRVRGTIQAASSEGVVIEVNGRPQTISPSSIRYIEYDNEPREISRARNNLNDGNFNECIAELARIEGEAIPPKMKEEAEYLKAMALALSSLEGSGSDPATAGSAVNGFLQTYPQTWHVVPTTEALGRLFLAFGRPDLAKAEFSKLTGTDRAEYSLQGHYYLGRIAMLEKDYETAGRNFEAIKANQDRGEFARTMKLMADCNLAAAKSLNDGNIAGAEEVINNIIRTESSTNQKLFAAAYNALGTVYMEADQFKKARNAFLKTQLLFPAEKDLHAESLARLSEVWVDLGQPEQGNRSKSMLLQRYPNSHWALGR